MDVGEERDPLCVKRDPGTTETISRGLPKGIWERKWVFVWKGAGVSEGFLEDLKVWERRRQNSQKIKMIVWREKRAAGSSSSPAPELWESLSQQSLSFPFGCPGKLGAVENSW